MRRGNLVNEIGGGHLARETGGHLVHSAALSQPITWYQKHGYRAGASGDYFPINFNTAWAAVQATHAWSSSPVDFPHYVGGGLLSEMCWSKTGGGYCGILATCYKYDTSANNGDEITSIQVDVNIIHTNGAALEDATSLTFNASASATPPDNTWAWATGSPKCSGFLTAGTFTPALDSTLTLDDYLYVVAYFDPPTWPPIPWWGLYRCQFNPSRLVLRP